MNNTAHDQEQQKYCPVHGTTTPCSRCQDLKSKTYRTTNTECKHEWRCAEHKYQWTLYYCVHCLKEQVQ